MTGKKEAVLILTHFIDDRIVAMFRRMKAEAGEERDVHVLFNKTDDNNPGYPIPPDLRVFAFEERDLRALGFPRKGRFIQDSDIELFSFTFRVAHPHYDRYWVIEYDVAFTGRWGALFDHFRNSDADLLATSIHRHAVQPEWDNWDKCYPPPGTSMPRENRIRAFLPCFRLSAKGYDTLAEAYRLGWHGHYECLAATLLVRAGLGVEDIGGNGDFVKPGNVGRFYASTPASNTLSPGTFVFRPAMTEAGSRPDTLYHPVKPPATHYVKGWRTGRLALLRRRSMAMVRSLAAAITPTITGHDRINKRTV